MKQAAPPLEDAKIPVKIKLSALWASLMLCFVYGDYFGLYVPGKLGNMIDGRMGPLGAVTQNVLVGTSIMMAIPALMVFLSLVMKPAISRWVNALLGLAYAAIMVLTMPGAWRFYQLLGVVEILLCLAIVGLALKWPRRPL
ncbi:hypothetical protein KW826_12980 [Pseudoxanthomonas sp. PXM05]|nr:hypothetical protein [Pseudoxanthomonas sp. PXM05]